MRQEEIDKLYEKYIKTMDWILENKNEEWNKNFEIKENYGDKEKSNIKFRSKCSFK